MVSCFLDGTVSRIWKENIKQIVNFDDKPKYLDATDGLAAAVCHYFQKNISNQDEKYSNWESFLKKNPKRLG